MKFWVVVGSSIFFANILASTYSFETAGFFLAGVVWTTIIACMDLQPPKKKKKKQLQNRYSRRYYRAR